MDWNFLDKMDKNFLYAYAEDLFSSNKNSSNYMKFYTNAETEHQETQEILYDETKKKEACYIIWFVYRYVLGCETLEQALEYATTATFKKYKLQSILRHGGYVHIGLGSDKIGLYSEADISVILEIIYNRYDFFEELDCFLRHTEGNSNGVRRKKAKNAMKLALSFLKEKEPEHYAAINPDIIRKYGGDDKTDETSEQNN